MAAKLRDMSRVESMADNQLRLRTRNGVLFVEDGEVIRADIQASNGVVHKIDEVLIPEDFDFPTECENDDNSDLDNLYQVRVLNLQPFNPVTELV